MPEQKPIDPGSEPSVHEPFITIDDCIASAEELLQRLSRLGAQKHPLDVRKGVRVSGTNNQPSRTVKASSRTYFFDVKTAKDGDKYLVITETRLIDRQSAQITVFPEDAKVLLQAFQEVVRTLSISQQ